MPATPTQFKPHHSSIHHLAGIALAFRGALALPKLTRSQSKAVEFATILHIVHQREEISRAGRLFKPPLKSSYNSHHRWLMSQDNERLKQWSRKPTPVKPFPEDLEEIDHNGEEGRTQLHLAVQSENTKLAKALLEDGIDVNERDNEGRTALHYANGPGVLRVLLESSNLEINPTDDDGRTPLHYAAMQGERVRLKLLLEKEGIQANVCDKYGRTPYDYSEGQMEVTMFAGIMFLLSYQFP
jgi:hypothetical protein